MPNHRNWFLRRRSPASEVNDDPLNEAGVLDLGRVGIMLRDAPALHVPPPQAAASGRMLPSSAFVLRPQLVRREAVPPADEPPIPAPPPRQRPRASERREPIEVERREAILPEHHEPPPVRLEAAPLDQREPPPVRLEVASAERREPPPARHEVAPPEPREPPLAHREPPPARREMAPLEQHAPQPARREVLPPERREPPPERLEAALPERRQPPPAERRAAFEFRIGSRRPSPPSAAAPEPAAKPARAAAPADPAAFTLTAPGPSWIRGRPKGADDAMRMHALLRDAFTPTRPKHDATLFSGRFREMQRIIAAIEEERAHVVVYGERGSGKTSLCNILASKASEAGYFTLQYSCSSGVSFEEIFRNFLRRVPTTFLAEGLGIGSRRVENFAQLLPEPPYAVSDLVDVFARIHDRHCIFIIDEYDRVTSEDVKAKLAELIKIMSDAAVPVTLLLIGVADDVRELFGKHPSLQRTLVTVPMPMMSRRDLEGLIAAGEAHAELSFAREVRDAIVDFAQGLPYQAQLLCLFAARNAVRRGSRQVEREDLRYAVMRATEEAESRIKEAYELALGTASDGALQDVLYGAARAPSDEYGTFTVADLAAAGTPGQGEAATATALKQLAEPECGRALRRIAGLNGPRYQFASHMFRNYVLVAEAVRRGTI